jgi:hypothetical protein
VFNVQVPRNENLSHRLNTTLRAIVEIAGDQPVQATNDKAVVEKASDVLTQYWCYAPQLRAVYWQRSARIAIKRPMLAMRSEKLLY